MIKSILSMVNKFVSDVYNKLTNKEPWYKYYDKGGKIDYPKLTIYELIEKTCETYPNNYAFEYYGNKITYKEFITQIDKCSKALKSLGHNMFIISEPQNFELNSNLEPPR